MLTPLQNFVPSIDELNLASRLLETNTGSWNRSDTLSVDAAIGIFKQSGVSFKQLRDIWSIADRDGSGKLSKEELAVVIRLTGWVQAGEALDERLLLTVGPLPKIKGIPDLVVVPKIDAPFPRMSFDDVVEFKQKFLDLKPVNGVLQKYKAMDVYMSVKPVLSFDELFRIMHLLDDKSGVFDFKSFALGMHIVRSLHRSLITFVPSSLLPEDYEILDDVDLSSTEEDIGLPILIQQDRTQSNSVDLPEKVESDILNFMKDVEQHNHITGHMTTKFSSEYGMNPTEMAQIWRQSDVEHNQKLTPARMTTIERLVRQQLAKKLSGSMHLTPPPLSAPAQPAPAQSPTGNSFHLPETAHKPSSEHPTYLTPEIPSPLPSNRYLPVLPPAYTTQSQSASSDSSTAIHEDFLHKFKGEVARLTSQLEVVVLDQTGMQNELRRNVEMLQRENLQLKLREQTLKDQLARKERDCDEAEELVDSVNLDLLEQQVISKEYQEAAININNEAEKLWSTVDTQSRQITTLLELVGDMKTIITELHDKPQEPHDLRLRFLRASVRESEAAATKAIAKAQELRQTILSHEQETIELRGRLEDVESVQPLSRINKNMLDLRNDHESLKFQMENMRRLMEQHLLPSSVQIATGSNDDTVPPKKAHRHENTSSMRGGSSESLHPTATEQEEQSDFTDSPPPFLSSSAHQPLPHYAHRASTPGTQLSDLPQTSREASTASSIDVSLRPPKKVSMVDRSSDPPLHNPQLEDDLHLFKLHAQRKGYIGIEMIQRFISNYDLEAYSLDEIGRLVDLDASVKRIDHAVDLIRQVVIGPRNIDQRLPLISLSRSSSNTSFSSVSAPPRPA